MVLEERVLLYGRKSYSIFFHIIKSKDNQANTSSLRKKKDIILTIGNKIDKKRRLLVLVPFIWTAIFIWI